MKLLFKRDQAESNTLDATPKIEENYPYPANTTVTTTTAIKTTATSTTTPVRDMSSMTTTSATKPIATTTTTATTAASTTTMTMTMIQTITPYSGVSIVASLCNGRLGNQVNKILNYCLNEF